MSVKVPLSLKLLKLQQQELYGANHLAFFLQGLSAKNYVLQT